MSVAGDSVWVISDKTTLNVRGSFYNMTDEFYNPALLLGSDGLSDYWSRQWYSSLYNSGYVYYPALDVYSGSQTGVTTNRLGRQGREWYQHPDAWTASVRMNRYQGRHNMKWGGEVRAYYGEAARFEPINLVFNSTLTANSSDTPDVVNSGNQWASFMLGALDNQTSARLVPLQTPYLRGYAAYFQDDYDISDRLTINAGLRWEFEPGPTDDLNRLSQRLDLTQPIPEMQSTPPALPDQARLLMASKGYSYAFNGAWIFTSEDSPHAWNSSALNFLPRVGVNYRLGSDSVVRAAYARFMMPTSNVRDTLGDFVNQYTGFAQTTTTLGLANGVPRQVLNDPFPSSVNPVIEPYGQSYGRYTGLGSAVSLDQYQLRPQINDRFNVSFQKEVFAGLIVDASYFFNWGSRVPYDINLNMADPSFRYEQKTLLNTQVANPFRNYLTPDKFPGQARNATTVTLGSLLVPYPQYGNITQTNTSGRHLKEHMIELRAQRPFTRGISFLVAYVYDNAKRQEFFDDRAQYQVLQSDGEEGWEWRPLTEANDRGANPVHRMTGAVTWQVPVGRERAFMSDMPTALDLVIGGWQYTAAGRFYSGRQVIFGTSYIVNGDPTGRQSDQRSLVRHERVRRAGHVHAAFQPVGVRRAERAQRVPHRHDLDEVVQPAQSLPARSAHRGLQRLQLDRVGRSGHQHLEREFREGDPEARGRHGARAADRAAVRVLEAGRAGSSRAAGARCEVAQVRQCGRSGRHEPANGAFGRSAGAWAG